MEGATGSPAGAGQPAAPTPPPPPTPPLPAPAMNGAALKASSSETALRTGSGGNAPCHPAVPNAALPPDLIPGAAPRNVATPVASDNEGDPDAKPKPKAKDLEKKERVIKKLTMMRTMRLQAVLNASGKITAEEDSDDEEERTANVMRAKGTGKYEHFLCYTMELGTGAYKTVYKGMNQTEAVEVAWNEMKLERLTSSEANRLEDEVKLLQTLRHKNVVRFFGSWNKGLETKIFITELMTAGTLKQFLRKTGKVKPRVLQSWLKQILTGLQYMHVKKIIHRDIKCDNIFVGEAAEVKIGDLGLASFVKEGVPKKSVIGTPEFMAPEMYREEYSFPIDIWAFGMSVLEMLTLEYPYSECSNAAQIYRKVSQGVKPSSYSMLDDRKDDQARDFVLGCITHNQKERSSIPLLLKHPFLKASQADVNKFDHRLTTVDMVAHSTIDGTAVVTLKKLPPGYTKDAEKAGGEDPTKMNKPVPNTNLKKPNTNLKKIEFNMDISERAEDVAKDLIREGLIDQEDGFQLANTLRVAVKKLKEEAKEQENRGKSQSPLEQEGADGSTNLIPSAPPMPGIPQVAEPDTAAAEQRSRSNSIAAERDRLSSATAVAAQAAAASATAQRQLAQQQATFASAQALATMQAQQAQAQVQAQALATATASANAHALATANANADWQAHTNAQAEAQVKVKSLTAAAQQPDLTPEQAQAYAEGVADAQAQVQMAAQGIATAHQQAHAHAQLQAQSQASAQALANAQAQASAQALANAQAQASAQAAQAQAQAQAANVQAQAQANANANAQANAQAAQAQAQANAQAANAQAQALAAQPQPPVVTSHMPSLPVVTRSESAPQPVAEPAAAPVVQQPQQPAAGLVPPQPVAPTLVVPVAPPQPQLPVQAVKAAGPPQPSDSAPTTPTRPKSPVCRPKSPGGPDSGGIPAEALVLKASMEAKKLEETLRAKLSSASSACIEDVIKFTLALKKEVTELKKKTNKDKMEKMINLDFGSKGGGAKPKGLSLNQMMGQKTSFP